MTEDERFLTRLNNMSKNTESIDDDPEYTAQMWQSFWEVEADNASRFELGW